MHATRVLKTATKHAYMRLNIEWQFTDFTQPDRGSKRQNSLRLQLKTDLLCYIRLQKKLVLISGYPILLY